MKKLSTLQVLLAGTFALVGIAWAGFLLSLIRQGFIEERAAADMMNAIARDDTQEVLRILNTGVSADSETEAGTPLISAVANRNIPMIRLLIERGANPHKRGGYDNKSPIELAQGDPQLLEALTAGRRAH